MVCVVLLAAFSGLVRDQLLRPDEIYWIDSLQDLYQWKELNIQTFRGTYIDSFIRKNPNDSIADNFRNRLQILDFHQKYEGIKHDLKDIDFNGIVEGRTAVVGYLQSLIGLKNILSDSEEDIDYHISTQEEVSQTMHFWTNGIRLNQSMFDKINMV